MKPARRFPRAARAALVCLLSFAGVSAVAATQPPKLFIAGDSTAATYNGANPQEGWGARLADYFETEKLRVVNAARGGRSSRTFVSEGHWEKMLAEVQAGDFVIIQFGQNDDGALNQEPPGSTKPLRARGTIPGIGDQSEEIDNVITGKHETVYSFGWYLRKMIDDTRAKGATPILLTLTARNHWSGERVDCPSATYRTWTWQTAQHEKVAFVDLTRIITDRYQREGPEAVKGQFGNDAVHTNLPGAQANAADVVSGLRALRGLKFDKKLSPAGRKVRADAGQKKGSVCPRLD
jgi:lysophospholipase L1-like esterase